MKFYKATETDVRPFIYWNGLAANSIDDLIALGLADDPLVLPDELRPDFQFGVCPLKIVDGELVERTEIEMDAFEVAYNQRQAVSAEATKVELINRGKFNHAGNFYPMHEAARLRYFAIAADAPGNQNFMTVTGTVVTVLEADLPTFLNKFYKEIQVITNVAP